MGRRRTYIVVEGSTDVDFVGRVLRKGPHDFRNPDKKGEVEVYWHRLIPTSYPVRPAPHDFLGRVSIPMFYQNATHTVAVQSADGIKSIPKRLEETIAALEDDEPDNIGVILDSDSSEPPAMRAQALATELAPLIGRFPNTPGEIAQPLGSVASRRGVFVFPDNVNQGTLEDLLIECGKSAYPELLSLAETHVSAARAKLLSPSNPSKPAWTIEDAKEFNGPSGAKKATIASAVAVLRPGRTTQVSLRDNRWVDPSTLTLPRVRQVAEWLERLII